MLSEKELRDARDFVDQLGPLSSGYVLIAVDQAGRASIQCAADLFTLAYASSSLTHLINRTMDGAIPQGPGKVNL